MKKNDLYLFGCLLLLALCLGIGYRLFFRQTGDSVVITVDGTVEKTLPLSQDATCTIHGAPGGSNTLVIRDGSASISDADCPDKLCVHQNAISHQGETLVCLPHKVVVSIKKSASSADSDDAPDAIAK